MNVQAIYDGSDGEATKALYARLAAFGPAGELALNLFRAQKSSTRAKVYRGGVRGRGSYRSMAYDRKNWAMSNLCSILAQHASALGVTYGWQHDDHTDGYAWILYCDLPTGEQVSFHSPSRGAGPDYVGKWDGVLGVSADRIVRWCTQLLGDPPAPVAAADQMNPRWLWCRWCGAWWANRRTCPVHPTQPLEEKTPPTTLPELRPGVKAQWDERSHM